MGMSKFCVRLKPKFHLCHGAEVGGDEVTYAQFVGEGSNYRYVIDSYFGAYVNLSVGCKGEKEDTNCAIFAGGRLIAKWFACVFLSLCAGFVIVNI